MADPNKRLPSDELEPPEPATRQNVPHPLADNETRRHQREHADDRGSLGITGGPEREAGHELER